MRRIQVPILDETVFIRVTGSSRDAGSGRCGGVCDSYPAVLSRPTTGSIVKRENSVELEGGRAQA